MLSDTRLPALASDSTTYVFSAPDSAGALRIDVQLLFRRAYLQLMEWKGWEVPDIEMERQIVSVP